MRLPAPPTTQLAASFNIVLELRYGETFAVAGVEKPFSSDDYATTLDTWDHRSQRLVGGITITYQPCTVHA